MSDASTVFKATLAKYYKAERDRTEECLGDIIGILTAQPATDPEQVQRILERLVKHYERAGDRP
jgi:hypothetical protein